jgi:photosystem II stability/assembly factor-like uncharacterized protein
VPEGAEKLDFRGIWAWDTNTAIVMSSGTGDLSRVYRTTDGCSHWTLVLTNPDKTGFFDAMVFADRQVGYLLGDPVNGAFPLLQDRGRRLDLDEDPVGRAHDGFARNRRLCSQQLLDDRRRNGGKRTAGRG